MKRIITPFLSFIMIIACAGPNKNGPDATQYFQAVLKQYGVQNYNNYILPSIDTANDEGICYNSKIGGHDVCSLVSE